MRTALLTLLFTTAAFAETDVLVVAKWATNLEQAEKVAAHIEEKCGGSVVVALSRFATSADLAALARHSNPRSMVLIGNGVAMPTRQVGLSIRSRFGESPFANEQHRRESEAGKLPYEDEEFRDLRETLRERDIRFSSILTVTRGYPGYYEGARRLAESTGGVVITRGGDASRIGCRADNIGASSGADRLIVLVDDPTRVGAGTNRTRAQQALEALMKDCSGREIAIVRYDPRVTSLILEQPFTTDRRKLLEALDHALEIPVRRLRKQHGKFEREFVLNTLGALQHITNEAQTLSDNATIVHLGGGIPIRGELRFARTGEFTRTEDSDYERFRRNMDGSRIRYIAFEIVPILGNGAAAAREIASATGGQFVPIGKTVEGSCAKWQGHPRHLRRSS